MPRKKIVSTDSHTRDVASSWAVERPDLEPDSYLHLIMGTRLGRVLERLFDERGQERFGLSSAELRVILALRRSGPPYTRRPTDLYQAVLVTSGAITKQVGRLVEAGYVERFPDPSNAKGFLVQLTPSGLRVSTEALDMLADTSSDGIAATSLTPQERHMFRILCEKFLLDLEQRYPAH